MSDALKLRKKLYNALKLSGFNVRQDFCTMIIERFQENYLNLKTNDVFENCVKNICSSLEKQCMNDKSIEAENITRAIDACLNDGCDKHETVFSVINAFDFPKLRYDPERKRFFQALKKSTFLSEVDSKAELFLERYSTILQRTKRDFKNRLINDKEKLTLQTVDFLLTLSHVTLNNTLILGSLLQVAEGRYFLEDPTGIVELDLTHAKFHGGLFVENSFVLVNGFYEDKKLLVSTIILPPGEEYKESRLAFANINYFGGESQTPLRDSISLNDYMSRNPNNMILFFSDVWLDHPNVFEKLEVLFQGMEANPPVAFVFMGNFMSESHGCEKIEILKKLFKQLGELIANFVNLVNNSHFVFVPGMMDPCTPHMVPRLSLPNYIAGELKKFVPKAAFATNPCRLQYCNKEIVVFRADVLVKLMQSTLHKPKKEELGDCITRTLVSHGHLSPLSLNALTIHWDFDYTLRLFPLPNLVVIGDKSEMYAGKYKGCQVANPGSFCESGFQFKCYTPFNEDLDDCSL